jgi:hypothetical protein
MRTVRLADLLELETGARARRLAAAADADLQRVFRAVVAAATVAAFALALAR